MINCKLITSLKILTFSLSIGILAISCQVEDQIIKPKSVGITGTWKLLSGTIIQGTDTTITDYTVNQDVIKIINESHFAFLRHDLGKDSIPVFVSGGGKCDVDSINYTEHLDFCNYREWENNSFEFKYTIIGDTLTTIGTEKVESINVNRLNIERYIRLKK